MTYPKFGKIIKQAREKKGLTQKQLADALGYETPQFISLVERDQSHAPLPMLGQMIVILEIDEKEIFDALVESYGQWIYKEIRRGKKMAVAS